MVTPEINREFIKRIEQGVNYLTEQIADIKTLLNKQEPLRDILRELADIRLLVDFIAQKEKEGVMKK